MKNDPMKDPSKDKTTLYQEAIRKYVCEHCVDFGADGACHSQDREGCGIFRNLPELIRIGKDLHSPSVAPYVTEVRREICSKCSNASFGGAFCDLRDNLDCPLDRYLPIVLEAIEAVDKGFGAV